MRFKCCSNARDSANGYLVPPSSEIRISFDFLFISFPRSRNKVKRAGLTRTITPWQISGEHVLRERTFPFFFFFFICSHLPQIPLSNQFLQSRVAFYRNRLRGNLYIGVIARARYPYSRLSIDLFRDPQLLLEIDSDISAPGGLLKLHTFLDGRARLFYIFRFTCASLFAFLGYFGFLFLLEHIGID